MRDNRPSGSEGGVESHISIPTPIVRLRAHLNSRVRVPDLADTVEPVTESNCAGAIPPGGKQLKVKHQSVTKSWSQDTVNLIRSAVSGEPAT